MTERAQSEIHREVSKFMGGLRKRNPGEKEFHQAVQEVTETLMPFLFENSKYRDAQILERMTEPDRVIIFRVTWEDDAGCIRANRAWRVQFNNSIGPYKGGMRFHPSVTLSVLKFLGFEQVFKNSLTTLPMGGGKGGSDFNPRAKSDAEVMRFCQAFMSELFRHIGPNTDVPAGDIGVGGREIGFLFGMYKKLANEFTGILTGKGQSWGGSLIRPEATGYGLVYFTNEMLASRGEDLSGKRVLISGSGNVAQYATEKVLELGGKVVTLSDSSGCIVDEEGIDRQKFEWVLDLKNNRRGRISEYAEKFESATFMEGQRPWSVPGDVALPCATQNELLSADAETLLANGCTCVAEGANMPTEPSAVERFQTAGILYCPGKASNAGGVAVSGLEMSQNSMRLGWSRQEVDGRLHQIMCDIHTTCREHGRRDDGFIDYVKGANVAGFIKIADAMLDQGLV